VNVFVVVVLNHEFYVPHVYMFNNLHFQGITLEYNLESEKKVELQLDSITHTNDRDNCLQISVIG